MHPPSMPWVTLKGALLLVSPRAESALFDMVPRAELKCLFLATLPCPFSWLGGGGGEGGGHLHGLTA